MLDGGEHTLAIDEIVSDIAGKTGTSAIKGVALIRNWHTDIVFVKHPIARALKTDLLIPVPSSTANIRDLLNRGKHASSINKVVSGIACYTISTVVVSITLVRNGNTNSIVIEDPIA